MSKLDYYIHDEADALQLQIEGDLAGPDVASPEQAWKTAKSVLDGRKLVIDLSRNAKWMNTKGPRIARQQGATVRATIVERRLQAYEGGR